MRTAVVVAGILAQTVAWRLVASGRTRFWPTTAATWAVVGLAAVLAGDQRCCAEVPFATALVVGLGWGVVLYAATRLVVEVGARVAPLVAAVVDDVYTREREVPAGVLWAVTLLIVVPAEELFWRGLALPELRRALGSIGGALVAWIAAVGVSASWASLPFLAAAFVSGAVWTALGAWSGGVVAPFASHVVWTAAMIAWRPRTSRAKVPT
jgi:membrane protease YdiL (CAAX protease family)